LTYGAFNFPTWSAAFSGSVPVGKAMARWLSGGWFGSSFCFVSPKIDVAFSVLAAYAGWACFN
jgi:hypothetical protein